MKTIELIIPTHFLPALINGDISNLSDEDEIALDALTDEYLADNDCFRAADTRGGCGFLKYHALTPFGVLASDCETVTFDLG